MREERLGGAVGDRPARRLAAAARADPAGLQQHVERALRDRHAADFLDLGARHRLVIGDDRQRLDRGARQLAAARPLRCVSSQDRSLAVRNVHLPPTRTRLTPRGAYSACSAAQRCARRRRPPAAAPPASSRRAARRRRTAAPRAAAVPPAALPARLARLVLAHRSRPAARRRHRAAASLTSIVHCSRRGAAGTGASTVRVAGALAQIDRRERRLLVHLDHALAHQFERRGEARRHHGRAHRRLDQIGDQDTRRAGSSRAARRSAARAPRAPRPATRPCAARSAHARARCLLALRRIGGQQIVERRGPFRLLDLGDRLRMRRGRTRRGRAAGASISCSAAVAERFEPLSRSASAFAMSSALGPSGAAASGSSRRDLR